MARPTILLVDDSQELLALLAGLVESEGWAPVTAARGRLALEKLRSEKPSAAVVDVLLPDMMGYDVALALRHAGVPFVFATGVYKGGRSAADARTQYGAAGYFEKPFEARKLLDALRALLPQGEAEAETTPLPELARPARLNPPDGLDDFDVEVAVETEEPVEGLELTGQVALTEAGRVSAVMRGAAVTAPPVRPPRAPAAGPHPVPARRDPPGREGRLADNLPDLFTAFHEAQQTGELTLQKGKVRKTIYFEQGRPCFAISNLVTDRFGPFLERVGKITAAQLAAVRAETDRTGRRSGEVLVELGLLREAEKLYLVAQQVKAIIYSVFGWEQGEYRLHFTDRAARESIKIDLQPAHLITRAVKKLYGPERLRRLLAPDDRLVPSPQPAFGLHEVELERWEAELLARVDGTRSTAELIGLAGRPPHAVLAFLHGMVCLRVLERV